MIGVIIEGQILGPEDMKGMTIDDMVVDLDQIQDTDALDLVHMSAVDIPPRKGDEGIDIVEAVVEQEDTVVPHRERLLV